MTGILVMRGISLSIGGPVVGQSAAGGIETKISYDACIPWAAITLQHRRTALEARERRIAAFEQEDDGVSRGASLEDEFSTSMQTIVSAAICIDALYDQVARVTDVAESTRKAWKSNKTARYKQVAETLRTAFEVHGEKFERLRRRLHVIYTLRDAAVHPSMKPQLPRLHPDHDVAMAWHLVEYRGDVADGVACRTMDVLWDFTHQDKLRSEKLQKLMGSLKVRLEQILPGGPPASLTPAVTFHAPPD